MALNLGNYNEKIKCEYVLKEIIIIKNLLSNKVEKDENQKYKEDIEEYLNNV